MAVPRGARILDGRGRSLIPGLRDAHVIVAGEAARSLYVANGVTTARDLGGRPQALLAWREEVRDGARVGPRLLVAGPTLKRATLKRAGWLGTVERLLTSDSALRRVPVFDLSPRLRVGPPAEAPAVVDSLARRGPARRGAEYDARARGRARQAGPVSRLLPLSIRARPPVNARGDQISRLVAPRLRQCFYRVAREGIEPPTRGFSVRCSTN